MTRPSKKATLSPYLRAIAQDEALPIDPEARRLWLEDLANPTRWWLRPILQGVLAVVLHLVWFLKRLPLPQFRAHGLLQRLICWFCTHFVSPQANRLILRHFASESNLLNFLIDNVAPGRVAPVTLYPQRIAEMREASFVEHDQALFRSIEALGTARDEAGGEPAAGRALSWQHWRPLDALEFEIRPRRTQVLDFESAHALFMCLFCLLLTREEYRDAINGFNLDQSIALRIGALIDEPQLAELAYNKHPLYLVGPWNLSQRFLMHGFFTEYLYARLERRRREGIAL
ncbi:DUF6999 family protein [Halomonas salifodinae]|uniref:DUF6999 family protein n=1 Tax=Halomonas salifodinae TaxID=438745 RepID=UPI0033B6E81C